MPPSNKKKKPVKKPRYCYSHEQLLKALEAYRTGENAFQVSKKYGVPRSTLIYKASGKLPLNKNRKLGPAPLLGLEAEDMLKNWIMGLATRGFPITKNDLITSVQQILNDLNATDKFPGGRPGETWLKLFLKRNPEISERTVEKLSKIRANVTESDIKRWFEEVQSYLNSNDLFQGLSDPTRVYNMDETAFFLCPKSDRVLGIKGQKNVYEVSSSNEKENVTVLANVNAAGHVAPTLIVYPGQRLPQALKLNVPEDWVISKSESGWINGEVFYEYFVNYFYEWLVQRKVQFPIIVFVDGHKSHITYHLSKFCSAKKIVLVALIPNCTHIIQPLDVAVFGPVKRGWVEAVHSWRMSSGGERLTKYNFATLLKTVFDKTMTEDTIKNGFIRCGLCPFDKDAVDYSKVDILNKDTAAAAKTMLVENHKQTKCHATNVSSHPEGENCLSFFEAFIPPDLLEKFHETYNKFTPIWNDDESAHDLYVAWKKAKDHIRSKEKQKASYMKSKSRFATLSSAEDDEESRVDDPDDITKVHDLQAVNDLQITPSKSSEPGPSNRPMSTTPSNSPALITNEPGQSTTATPSNSSASKEKLAEVLSPGTNGAGVPSPFKKNLFWPGTPQKTKKKTRVSNIRLPSVVSSKQWQYYEEKKRAEKKAEEDKKAERKRIREEKRKGNQKKSKVSRKKVIEDEADDWICNVCKKRFSAEIILGLARKWINCDSCNSAYHYKCIPKKHLNTFGIDSDDDEDEDEFAFMCHNCVSDSDNDPLVLSELEEE